MSYFIYSDFHLGGPEGMSFKQDEKRFISYIEEKTKEGTVIFNGDVFDLYETSVFCDSQKRKFERIIKEYPLFYNLIKEGKVIYVEGNHDERNEFTRSSFTVTDNGKKLHVEHGHKYDNTLDNYCCCECFWCPKGYRCFGSFLSALNCFKVKTKDEDYPEIGLNVLEEKEDVDILVFGHTHGAMIEEFKGRYYVNTGHVCTLEDGDLSFDETVITLKDKIEIKQNKVKL